MAGPFGELSAKACHPCLIRRVPPAAGADSSASRATTRIVSSPAMVPTTSGSPERSIALARNCAAPGGVRSTARLPLASAPVSSSRSSRISRAGRLLGRRAAAGGRPPGSGSAPLTLTAPSSSRSRDSVAWVTCTPSAASSSASSVCDRTACVPDQLVDRACRAARVSGPVTRRSASTSQASSAFCACSRFSAWSKTALCGAVHHLVGDLLAAVRGQAVQHDRVGAAAASSALLIWYGRNGVIRSRPSSSWPIDVQVSVAITSAPSTRLERVAQHRRPSRRSTRRSRRPGPRRPDPGRSPTGRRPARACPAVAPAEQVRVRHVVRRVADVGQRPAGGARRAAPGWSAGRRATGTGGSRR